jgi:hypothetical protein
MIRFVLLEQKKLKNILVLVGILIALLSLYTFLDNYGYQSYATLGDAFGYNTVIATISLNVLISLVSALTISFTLINFRFNNAMTSGSIISSVGNVFAVIFTGCASCGLSLLGAIGLSIGLPAVTPGAVKYKFFALLVIILGLIIVLYLINNATCSIKKGGK